MDKIRAMTKLPLDQKDLMIDPFPTHRTLRMSVVLYNALVNSFVV